jgi:hypothetical protein
MDNLPLIDNLSPYDRHLNSNTPYLTTENQMEVLGQDHKISQLSWFNATFNILLKAYSDSVNGKQLKRLIEFYSLLFVA